MFIKNGSFKKYSHIISYVPPYIIQEPLSGISKLSDNFKFKILVKGSKPIEYKWFKNDFPIPNSNTETLLLSNVQYSDQAKYYCKVKNNAYSLYSRVVELSVLTIPIILNQPNSVVAKASDNINFNIDVASVPPTYYQWYKDGLQYPAYSSSLYINFITKFDEGDYFVVVSNSVGSVTSDTVNLSLYTPLDITRHPKNTTINQGSSGNLYVNYTGSRPVTAQWLKNNINYGSVVTSNTNTVNLNILNVSLSDSGNYNVILSNVVNTVTSSKAVLYVNSKVDITTQPVSATVKAGSPYTFFIQITGTDPITYRWIRNSSVLYNSNNRIYSIQNVSKYDEGDYYCVATNLVNSVTSNVVSLSVTPNIFIIKDLDPIIRTDLYENITIQVDVSGNLPIYYYWYKDGQRVNQSQTDNFFEFLNVDVADEGHYQVVAENDTGVVSSFNTYLDIASDVLMINETDYFILDDNTYMLL